MLSPQLHLQMEECEKEFSSKKSGSTSAETRDILKAVTEKRTFIQQATEVVKSQGRKLQDILKTATTTASSKTTPTLASGGVQTSTSVDQEMITMPLPTITGVDVANHSPTSFLLRRAQSSEDILEAIDEPSSSSSSLSPPVFEDLQRTRAQSYGNAEITQKQKKRTRSGSGSGIGLGSKMPPRSSTHDGDWRGSVDLLDVRKNSAGSSPLQQQKSRQQQLRLRGSASNDDLLEDVSSLDYQTNLDHSPRHTRTSSSGGGGSAYGTTTTMERSNSWDVLGDSEKSSSSRLHSMANVSLSSSLSAATAPASPKVLVTPRRTRTATVKATLSVSSLNTNQNQQLVKGFLVQIENRLNQLVLLWEGRRKGLEEVQKVQEFREAVPVVLEWVESVGAEFLRKFGHYGRSIEEVFSKILYSLLL